MFGGCCCGYTDPFGGSLNGAQLGAGVAVVVDVKMVEVEEVGAKGKKMVAAVFPRQRGS